jgi:hypothetical protein
VASAVRRRAGGTGDAEAGVSGDPGRRALLGGAAAALLGGRPALAAEPADHRPELLLVGPGKQYASITAAGERLAVKWDPNDKVPNHDPVHIVISPAEPGFYDGDGDTYSRRWPKNDHGGWPPYHGLLLGPAVIEGEPGKPAPELTCSTGDCLYYQKGLWITDDYDVTFRRLRFSGFRRNDGYGNHAAVRLETLDGGKPRRGHFLFEDVRISGCDDGILGGSPGQTVTLRRCEFTRNGGGAGRTHNIYIGPVDLLEVEDVLSTRSTIGHLLKSRAAKTVIRRTRLLTGDGTTSACLDLPDGGILEIDGLVCEKGPNSDASWLIHYAGENQDAAGMPFHPASAVTIRNLVMIAPERLARHPGWPIIGFANQSGDGEAASGAGSRLVRPDVSGVQIWGMTARQAGLPGAVVLAAPPTLDWSTPVQV